MPCWFCSALSHRFGRPCGGNLIVFLESVFDPESVSVEPPIGKYKLIGCVQLVPDLPSRPRPTSTAQAAQ